MAYHHQTKASHRQTHQHMSKLGRSLQNLAETSLNLGELTLFLTQLSGVIMYQKLYAIDYLYKIIFIYENNLPSHCKCSLFNKILLPLTRH